MKSPPRRRFLRYGLFGLGLGLGGGLSLRAQATDPVAPPAVLPPLAQVQGRIVFDVFYGRMGVKVGEAEHRWHLSATRYEMEVRAKTTGLVALFGDFDYVQQSRGRVSEAGFFPERFDVHQARKGPEQALFDWTQKQVVLYRNDGQTREAELNPGDQDVLSLWHQIARITQFPAHLLVVSNKAAKPATLEKHSDEVLELPPGSLAVERLRARTDDGQMTIDLWRARKPPFLPVRVRLQDDRGDVFDQRARLIEWPMTLTPSPAPQNPP